jgi:LysR family carnitine catabolism transcriptional activator
MSVTLRQLAAFVAVAESGHFTRAANTLKLSQSTVSALVRDLENNLGLRLFDRHTRMLRLTDAGKQMMPVAKKAIADIDSVIGNASELRTLGRGRVSIAVSAVQAAIHLPRVIQEFGASHPGVKVIVHDLAEETIPDYVASGEADIGLGTSPHARKDIVTRVLHRDTFVVVATPDHPLAHRKALRWQHVAGYPVIGTSALNPFRERLDLALAREGITLRRVYEASLALTVIGMVEAGLGVAVMTSGVTKLAQRFGLVTRVPQSPTIRREFALLLPCDKSMSPATQQFHDLLLRRRAWLA